MTVPNLHRLAAPGIASLVTAAIVVGGLWIQHARDSWPFAVAAEAAPMDDAMPPSGSRSAAARVPIEVTPSAMQQLGIRVEPVTRESITETIRAVASVVPDESRISHVHTRVSGWIEQLDVNTTGVQVHAGQPIARVFSQELFSSQAEYLAIRKATSAAGIASVVVESGRTRLSVLGMTAAEIGAIEQSGEPRRLFTVTAPHSGVVVDRGVSAGTSIDPSTTLLTIADLSRVWIIAEVPEADIASVRIGTPAQLDFPGSGRPPFAARVEFIYPTLTERTRTLRVRLPASNANGALRPGLYGTVSFASPGPPVLTVPRDALIDTGIEQHVFVVDGEHFEPRVVTIGVQLTDRVEIRAGLAEGEQIVSAGVFLLDSESRLRATGNPGGHAGHAGHGASTNTSTSAAADPHANHRR